jgi:hypothetical protein
MRPVLLALACASQTYVRGRGLNGESTVDGWMGGGIGGGDGGRRTYIIPVIVADDDSPIFLIYGMSVFDAPKSIDRSIRISDNTHIVEESAESNSIYISILTLLAADALGMCPTPVLPWTAPLGRVRARGKGLVLFCLPVPWFVGWGGNEGI